MRFQQATVGCAAGYCCGLRQFFFPVRLSQFIEQVGEDVTLQVSILEYLLLRLS
jgi:hypothetical protein